MVPCPACSKPVDIQEKHYGTLFTCAYCRGVYFIGWDGTPEKAPVHQAEPDVVPSSAVSTNAVSSDLSNSELTPEPEPIFEGPVIVEASQADEPHVQIEENFEPADAIEQEEASSWDSPIEAASAADFSDVMAYGNSDEAASGPLSYTVFLSGLELAETFERLREALTDSRFGWDVDELMGQVRGGALTIKAMNPTKASILISRVKYLPIEIDWKQEVFGGS